MAVQSYCGKIITEKDQIAIEAAFKASRISNAEKSAQEANFSERLHYDLHGYKRLFPPNMYMSEYFHSEPTQRAFTDEWIFE
jgi:hypothetical protein